MLSRHRAFGFTLIELVASAAVITLLMLMLVQMSKATGETWKKGLARAEEFRESRRAFEMVTRRLGTATLNTYWDYEWAKGLNPDKDPPSGYMRQSELRFRVLPMADMATETGYHPGYGVFFQSPAASVDIADPYWTGAYPRTTDLAPVTRLDGMLNTWGYFLEVGDTTKSMPGFLAQNAPPRYRSQLMEFREDATKLTVYKIKNTGTQQLSDDWFALPIARTDGTRPTHIIAENIITLVLRPRLSASDEAARKLNPAIGPQYQLLSPTFDYHSKKFNNYGTPSLPPTALPNQINPYNQLPPVVGVVMVALDENSAQRLAVSANDPRKLDLDVLTDGLFQQADQLETHDNQEGDLSKLETRLLDRKLGFRIFTSNVSIRGARWSSAHVDQ